MNGDSAQVTVGVHVHPETSMAVTAFDRFVTIAVGELPGMATLFLHSEDELDRLAAAVGEARAKFAAAQTWSMNEGRPEVPVSAC